MQKTDTPCKNCTFAEYEGITQTGCELGRLDIFRANGVNIIEAYDEEKQFYVIEGRRCMYSRTNQWSIDHQDDPIEDLLASEVEMPYQAIVIVNDKVKDLIRTLKSLWNQDIKPQHVTIIRPFYHIKNLKFDAVRGLMEKSKVPWRMETIVDPEWSHRDMVDLVVPFVKFPYYAVFKAGIVVPRDTFRIISDKINDESFVFSALSPNKDGQGLVVPHMVHKLLMGNKDKPLLDKIRKQDECQIIPITEVCPNFPR